MKFKIKEMKKLTKHNQLRPLQPQPEEQPSAPLSKENLKQLKQ